MRTSQGAFQRGGIEEMEDFLACAERVPGAKYILAHFVGLPKDNPPVVDTYLDMIDKWSRAWPDNFWAEIAQFNSPGVRSALARIPADRLLSGTDWTTRVGPPFLPFGANASASKPAPQAVAVKVDYSRVGATREESRLDYDRLPRRTVAARYGMGLLCRRMEALCRCARGSFWLSAW
jgi:hypothetical protein